MSRLDPKTRAYILAASCEGMSLRSIERIFGVGNNAISKEVAHAGDWAIDVLDGVKGLTIDSIQCDELYAFVAAREHNVQRMRRRVRGAGRVWAYLAVEPKSKYIFAYHLGRQSLRDATIFMQKVASKLERNPDGSFVVRPTIVTDGLKAYPEAVDRAFGSDVHFGVIRKSYSKTDEKGNKLPGGRFLGSTRIVVKGRPDVRAIHTNYVERQNLNLRMGNRRYTRRTNAFSKQLLNHERQLALWIVYHNNVLIPRPVPPAASQGAS